MNDRMTDRKMLPWLALPLCLSLMQVSSLTSRANNSLEGDDAVLRLTELLKGYDKRVRPFAKGPALNVSFQIYIVAFGPVDDKNFIYRLDFYARMWWIDKRLALGGNLSLLINIDPRTLIWTPDIMFLNSLESNTHSVSTDNMRLKIDSEGNVHKSMRISLKASCQMDFHYYPFDTQRCPLDIGSYSFSGKDIKLRWKEHLSPVIGAHKGVSLDTYYLRETESHVRVTHYPSIKEDFYELVITFILDRNLSFYLYHYYLPSVLLVLLTLASFWIPPKAVPARITLIVINFLAINVILEDIIDNITKLPYRTLLEIFQTLNQVFILIAMIEYVLALRFRDKRINDKIKKSTRLRHDEYNIAAEESKPGLENNSVTYSRNDLSELTVRRGMSNSDYDCKIRIDTSSDYLNEDFSKSSKNLSNNYVDRHARWIFPVIYLMFLTIYAVTVYMLIRE